tara:strand:+ start:723 stop:1619 length:897 start_codon:yes stop_codon:yes gene_type:complete
MNENCYTIKEYNFKKGVFDDIVDVTYIITMHDSFDRHKSIFKQLKYCVPTKKVCILYNKGYKKCEKYDENNEKINITYKDLTYTNMYIFELAKSYDNILILEDDFLFTKYIKNQNNINNVVNFIKSNKPELYLLGCLPLIQNIFTIFGKHNKLYVKMGTHAVIYSKVSRKKVFDIYKSRKSLKTDIDLLTNNLEIYTYQKPLCIQTFPETENKKSWGKNIPFNLHVIPLKILNTYLNTLEMDKEENILEKFEFNYKFLKILHILVLFIIFYFIKSYYQKSKNMKIINKVFFLKQKIKK